VRAGIVVHEALQTLADIPFLILASTLFLLAPYRFNMIIKSFKTTPANAWRSMIGNLFLQVIIDVPYTLMFLVLCLSVFMVIKLRK